MKQKKQYSKDEELMDKVHQFVGGESKIKEVSEVIKNLEKP